MNRAALLLLLALAAFAGAVAYLHHRALAPRPKTTAELALERQLPRLDAQFLTFKDRLASLQQHTEARVEVAWDGIPSRYRPPTDTGSYWRAQGPQTLEQAMDRLQKEANLSPAFWTDGSVIRWCANESIPRVWRVHEVSDLIESFCAGVGREPVPWENRTPERQARWWLAHTAWRTAEASRLRRDLREVGGNLVMLCTAFEHRHIESRLSQLRLAPEWTPSRPGVTRRFYSLAFLRGFQEERRSPVVIRANLPPGIVSPYLVPEWDAQPGKDPLFLAWFEIADRLVVIGNPEAHAATEQAVERARRKDSNDRSRRRQPGTRPATSPTDHWLMPLG